MGRKGKRGGRQQQRVKGFRPGKEPPHLQKQQAKAQLGKDATWSQKQTVEALAGRSPEEVQTMVGRWALGLLVAAVTLGVLGVVLYRWSIIAAVVVHVLAVAAVFLWYRLRRQREQFVKMAESFGGGRRS